MRIVCDSCGAKYSIADEKISGKLFKVRCKKCDTMIMVDGTNLDGAVAVPPAEGEPATGWYVVIDGAQTGPMSVDEVIAQVEIGAVDAGTFGWRDGMGDWQPLSDIAEFQGLLPESDSFEDEATRVAQPGEFDVPSAAPAPTPMAEPAPAIPSPPSGSGLLSHSVNTAAGPSDFFGGGGAAAAAPAPAEESAPPEESNDRAGLTEKRSESSVLFSLNDLTSSKIRSKQDDLPRTDGSGLIDIRVLANASAPAAADENESVAVSLAPMALPPRKSNTGLVAAIGVGVIVMLGLVGVLVYIAFFQEDPVYPPAVDPPTVADNSGEPATGEEPVADQEPEPTPPTPPVAGSVDAVPALAQGSGEGASTEGSGAAIDPSAQAALGSPGEAPTGANAEEPSEPANEDDPAEERDDPVEVSRAEPRDEPEEEPAREPEEPAEREASSDGPPSRDRESGRSSDAVGNALDAIRSQREEPEEEAPAEEGLTRDDVRATIRRYRSQVARCNDGEGGRYSIRFTVQPSGSVTNVRAEESNDVSQCIVGVVRDMSFPEFSGNAVPVTYPFNL